MNKKNKKILLVNLLVLVIILSAWMAKIAYEHRGVFEYKFNLLVSDEYSSYQNELIELSSKNPEQAFIRFREILNENPLSYNTCHGIAHQMGHETYDAFGFQKAMEVQNALCGAGYVHGVIEGRFGLLREKDILDELPTLCEKGNKSCYHGIGHGLMIATNLNVSKSPAYCDLIPGVGARNCYDGAWMHIFDLEESGAREIIEGPIQPTSDFVTESVSLCATTSEIYRTSCYFYLPRIYAHYEETVFEEYRSLCENVEHDYQIVCAAGSGHSVMKYHIVDPNASINRCNAYNTKELVLACKEGGFLYYLFAAETASLELIDLDIKCEEFANIEDKKVCLKVNAYRGEL